MIENIAKPHLKAVSYKQSRQFLEKLYRKL